MARQKTNMTIKQVQEADKKIPKIEEREKGTPLLQISLPAPASGDPSAPLPIGQHNAAAQKNFKQVADLMQALINNQKLMSMAITEINKEIKKLRKNDKNIIKSIKKLLGEEKEDDKNESPGATKA